MTDERLQSQCALKHPRSSDEAIARDHYPDVFRETPAIVAILDDRGVILSMSRECASRFGSNAARMVGRSILSLAHRNDRPRLAEALQDARNCSDRIAHCEFRIWRGSKPAVNLSASIRAANPGSGPSMLLAACSDITDRVSLESQLGLRRHELNRMASALLVAEDRERRRIADIMHDSVGHSLALAKFHIDGLDPVTLEPEVGETVSTVQALLQESIDSLRSLTFSLNSPLLQMQGLDAAVEDLGQTLAAGNALEFSLSSRPRTQRLCQKGRITLFRIIRELLVNVVKHAQARRVRVSIGARDDTLHIAVIDDGTGISPQSLRKRECTGIRLIRRKLHSLGGSISFESRSGGVVLVRVPYSQIGASEE